MNEVHTQITVSVIMPSWNSEQFIADSVRSVLQQTHTQLELIVVDDGSTDRTQQILAEFQDSRLYVHGLSETSGGPAYPRNVGLRFASGQYVAFIDSDDQWHPQKLALQLQVMLDNELEFSSTRVHAFQAGVRPRAFETIDDDCKAIQITAHSHSSLLKKNRVATSSALVKREALADLEFDEGSELVGVEDYFFWLYLHQSMAIKSANLELVLVWYRLRQDSLSASKKRMALKVWNLLGSYQIAGKGLGWKRSWYFICYVVLSLWQRVKGGR